MCSRCEGIEGVALKMVESEKVLNWRGSTSSTSSTLSTSSTSDGYRRPRAAIGSSRGPLRLDAFGARPSDRVALVRVPRGLG